MNNISEVGKWTFHGGELKRAKMNVKLLEWDQSRVLVECERGRGVESCEVALATVQDASASRVSRVCPAIWNQPWDHRWVRELWCTGLIPPGWCDPPSLADRRTAVRQLRGTRHTAGTVILVSDTLLCCIAKNTPSLSTTPTLQGSELTVRLTGTRTTMKQRQPVGVTTYDRDVGRTMTEREVAGCGARAGCAAPRDPRAAAPASAATLLWNAFPVAELLQPCSIYTAY